MRTSLVVLLSIAILGTGCFLATHDPAQNPALNRGVITETTGARLDAGSDAGNPTAHELNDMSQDTK